MFVTCLDLEGVLVPEIWIAVAEKTGIEELRLTTRDISDYDVLMKKRLQILEENNLRLKDIQNVIKTLQPLAGAKSFLDSLRQCCQTVILSDTFSQFALPLMQKLDMPTIFCNELIVSDDNNVIDYAMRQNNGKYYAVKGFQSMGLSVISAGDSFNDLEMIKQSEYGFLFKAPEHIIKENHEIQSFTEYSDLLQTIRKIVC